MSEQPARAFRECPKCGTSVSAVDYEGNAVHTLRCPKCGSTWKNRDFKGSIKPGF